MATRRSPSRDSSVSRPPLSQRPSISRLSNPDVFSDEFALPSEDYSPNASPVDSIDRSMHDLPIRASIPPRPPRVSTVIPSTHLETTSFSRPNSTSKRPLLLGDGQTAVPQYAFSSVAQSDAATQRSSSVSSHLSVPRAQSPYTGPTAPTQPYAMYPQVTRASSVASESTIRPIERPYLSTGGPEHPYGMYPQNTVEEDDDDDDLQVPTLNIPLGFPGMRQIYGGNRAASHDVGDIVGSDGHIEQLPPYTRYADNTIAKAASEHGPAPVAAADLPLSPISQADDSDVDVNTAAARDAGEPTAQYSEKSKTRKRLSKKVCWGVSLCVWLLVVGVVVIAATLGGVIGGVIGNDKATDAAADSSSPTATTTLWLDASPLPTGMPPPTCTPGHYNMPTTDISLDTSSCILSEGDGDAWGCLQQESIPFEIDNIGAEAVIKLGLPGPGKTGQPFNYGAQVPDLNGTHYPLSPSVDKDWPKLGGAMFFNVLYDKLTVVPASAFSSNSKRSIRFADVQERTTSSVPVTPGDMPYFCWFNQTLLELFIYSNVSTTAAAANSTAFASPLSTIASYSSFSVAMTTSLSAQTTPSMNANQLSSQTTQYGSYPSYSVDTYPWPSSSSWAPPPPPPPPSGRRQRRGDGDNDGDHDFPIYPRKTRLAEKRAPSGNDVQPYCVQMEVQQDYSVCEVDGTQRINITEVEPNYTGSSRRWNRPRKASSNNNLGSNCACQWYSS